MVTASTTVVASTRAVANEPVPEHRRVRGRMYERAPGGIVATPRGPGNAGGMNAEVPADWAADRTRPLCPYPSVARYKGHGRH